MEVMKEKAECLEILNEVTLSDGNVNLFLINYYPKNGREPLLETS